MALQDDYMKPELVDNRNGNTLVAALRGHLDWLGQTYARPAITPHPLPAARSRPAKSGFPCSLQGCVSSRCETGPGS